MEYNDYERFVLMNNQDELDEHIIDVVASFYGDRE